MHTSSQLQNAYLLLQSAQAVGFCTLTADLRAAFSYISCVTVSKIEKAENFLIGYVFLSSSSTSFFRVENRFSNRSEEFDTCR